MHIHIADTGDDNVRMVLPPSGDGAAPVVYTYTVAGVDTPAGITFDGTHIHIADATDDNVRMVLPPSGDGAAPVVYTYTVPGVGAPAAMTFDGTHIHIADTSDDNVRMVLPPSGDGAASVVYTYTAGFGNSTGLTFDGTHIHIADASANNVRMVLPPSSNGAAPVVYTYTVPGIGGFDSIQGITFDGTHIHIAATTDDVRMILPPSSNGAAPVVYTYTVPGAEDIRGMAFDGSPAATLTITTTDTDIRAGETVDFDIASDIDISDFAASDITVTGGTRGALTETDAQNFVLRVTAGSAGTLTIAIAEDAVTPGNAAVSQNFTVNARISGTITFDETELETDGTTEVTVTLSETPDSNLASSGLTTSAGTLSAFSGSGRNYTATLTAPSSGSGTITVTLAADAVEAGGLGNLAVSADIDYAEPPMNLTVTLSGDTDIEQGESTTITATVTDADGNAVEGVSVDFSAPMGSFSATSVDTDSNGEAPTDWTADFTDSDDVDVVITADATQAANDNPTVSSATLNSMASLGIENIVANMLITSTGDINPSGSGSQDIYRMGQVGTIDPNSDPDVTSELAINRVRWSPQGRQIILNRNGTLDWRVWDDTHTELSLFVITDDGTYLEFPVDEANAVGGGFINWVADASETDFTDAMGGIDAGDSLLIGFGDSDSVGIAADSGTGTVTVTAEAAEVLVATTVVLISGNTQTAPANTALPNPFVVQVNDQNGDPLSGVTVMFQTSGGTLSETSVTTGTNGQASSTLILSSANGVHTATANVQGVGGVIFIATATPVATTLEVVSGNNQSNTVGEALDNPLVVRILDQNGDALSGITVNFATTGGTLSASSDTTDSNGQASVNLTLPSTTGEVTVTASSTGLTDVTFTATANAEALVATTLTLVSGNNQSADVSEALANPLVVQVDDQNGDALSGINVSFSTTGGTLSDSTVTTDTNGRASVTLTLPSSTGDYTVTASVSGLTDVEFTATATTETLVATTLTAASGDSQTAEVSTALDDPVVVRVDDQNGDALSGVDVTFSISPTDGALGTENATTDASGEASTTVQLGATEGDYTITASVSGLTDVEFTATATAATTPETPVVAEQQELTEGNLFSIDANGDITDKGFVWHTERPYNVFIGKMLVVGDDLHVMAGYGDPDKILQNESLASKADNFVHLVFGETLRYILPTFEPDSSIHAELSTLAKNVNATVSFTNGIIQIADRLPFRALTNGQTGTGTTNIAYDGQNKPFPASGYLLAGSEVISYTGNAGGAFTGVGRGVLGTEVVNHFDNSRILYLDNIVEGDYLSLNLQSDTNRVYNIIRNSDLTAEVRDAASIALYGERAYTLDLTGLTRHENQWVESIFNEYLQELKNLESIVNIRIRADFTLELGQIVPFRHENDIQAMRITSIKYEQSGTTIKGRTITV